jgi:hypothetical protein
MRSRAARAARIAAPLLLFALGAVRCGGPAASSVPTTPLAATPTGYVTYRLAGGDLYRLEARRGARPTDVSTALDALSPAAPDEWLNTSANGRWLLTSTERFGCGGWACLARVSGTLRSGAAIRAPRGALHADAFGAISSDGRTVVYPQGGGRHIRDLWVTRLVAGSWTAPRVITDASRHPYNMQPAISADGRRVKFDCGPGVPEIAGTSICEVSSSGGPVTVVIAPTDGPGGSLHNLVHHPAFAPGGGTVFEADWHGEQIWRVALSSRRPVLVSRVHNDNSPCVLADGRIVSIDFDRPGNRRAVGELRVADPHTGRGAEILTGHNVADIGIGCGGGASAVAAPAAPRRRSHGSIPSRTAAPTS